MQKSLIDPLRKKQKVEDSVVKIIHEKFLSGDEIIDCKTRTFITDKLSIVFVDWFYSVLLQYLSLKVIANFDLAVCNRRLRPQWLESLGKYASSVPLKIFKPVIWSHALVNWIIQRKLQFSELALDKGYPISMDDMYRLAKQCPNLKALNLSYDRDVRLQLRL